MWKTLHPFRDGIGYHQREYTTSKFTGMKNSINKPLSAFSEKYFFDYLKCLHCLLLIGVFPSYKVVVYC
ncbi:hypothetical protein GDO81_007393 [Engystomops pustulosus]|uniref:Uncharacterized protein n=1 Tax=Engystomops pustulosus TaxID=76066 RepID=A0AAV7C7V7_ENGPU|nr:hypothetical protein GDO81_007393 [Engystomops pustulosus]